MFDIKGDPKNWIIVKRFHGEDTVFSVMEKGEASQWPSTVYYPLLHLGEWGEKEEALKARDEHVSRRRAQHKKNYGWEGNFYPIPN